MQHEEWESMAHGLHCGLGKNSQNSVENKFSKKDSLAVNKHHYYGNCDRP